MLCFSCTFFFFVGLIFVVVFAVFLMMVPAMAVENKDNTIMTANSDAQMYQKGVKHLCDKGLKNLIPFKYVLPVSDRPSACTSGNPDVVGAVKLPVVDFAELCGPNRRQVLRSLAEACEKYGFFQVGLLG